MYILLCYLDTDSFCICTIGELDDIVKDSKKLQWKEAKKEWFVVNNNDPLDLRMPGKMKLEWRTTEGAMTA